jgi:hypothetical protein
MSQIQKYGEGIETTNNVPTWRMLVAYWIIKAKCPGTRAHTQIYNTVEPLITDTAGEFTLCPL